MAMPSICNLEFNEQRYQNVYKILVAEDSPTQARILEKSLDGDDFNIIIKDDGQQAYEWLCANEQPDLILSDLEMPVMNGYEFCNTVKQSEKYKHIPFILVTTLNDPDSLLKGIEAGADSYITKPYSAQALRDKIALLIERDVIEKKEDTAIVSINGQDYNITADKQHILNFLITTYNNVVKQNEELNRIRNKLNRANSELETSRSEMQKVLNNVFPQTIAEQLLKDGIVSPARFENVTVVFTDFVNFSQSAEKMPPDELVLQIEKYFSHFDSIIEKYNLEKIKTIGDSYMFAGGLPTQNSTHAVDCVLASMEMMKYVQENMRTEESWDLRIGINSGPVVAGIIGNKRFAYDIWGPTVNISSRMEQASQPGFVNISEQTFNHIKGFFYCEARGSIDTKNSGMMNMFFVKSLHAHLHEDNKHIVPNSAFEKKYNMLRRISY